MGGGSVSTSFSGVTYEFDNVDVNINGRINCTYYHHGNCSIQCPSGNLMDIIESMVYKFVKMLPDIVDASYDTIDFWGDVIAADDNIKAFPIYFILSGSKYGLYKIDSRNVTQIYLISTFENFNDAINRLYDIDKQILESYYYEQDDDKTDCEVLVNAQLVSERNATVINVSKTQNVQDINGDCNYDIVEIMHGDITGDQL